MKNEKLSNTFNIKALKDFNEEIVLNCCIQDDQHHITLSGKVINVRSRKPICRACIKFADENYTPLYHCFTDKEGCFCLKDYFQDYIRIIVSVKGYKTFSSRAYSITDSELEGMTIELTPSCKVDRIITGIALDCEGYPAKNVYVVLKNDEDYCTHSTYTNENGVFVFDDVAHGFYTILFYSSMYEKYFYDIFFQKSSILFLGKIYIKKKNLKGTLNGVITDEYSAPINDALVILFDAVENRPLQVTRTNENGIYLFYNLDIGRYYIVVRAS